VPRGDMASHLQMKEAAPVGGLFSHTGAYRADRPGVEPPL
jgi:hypothetical protein